MKHLLTLSLLAILQVGWAQSEYCLDGTVWDATLGGCVPESDCLLASDLDGDGSVGSSDLLSFLSEFGGSFPDADADGICDDNDDCVGEVDECGVCNGPGPTIEVILDITILYDSVYADPIDEWLVFEVGADTTFTYTCAPIVEECDESVENCHCFNGEYNPFLGEHWVDCGGPCDPCDVHANGVLDEDAGEIGIDCGCDGCPACPELCGDGLFNGLEFQNNPNSIPDCGGPDCGSCPTCDDLLMNGNEIGIDCGGSFCEPCVDCLCDCTNGVQEGFEQYIDCGGPSCPDCTPEMSWLNMSNQFIASIPDVTWEPSPWGGTRIILTGFTPEPDPSQIYFSITEPAEGWSNGITISKNEGTYPLSPQVATFYNAFGQYSTVVGGNMTLNITFIELDPSGEPLPGGVIVGNFAGTMGNSTGYGAPIEFTSGSFLLEFQ